MLYHSVIQAVPPGGRTAAGVLGVALTHQNAVLSGMQGLSERTCRLHCQEWSRYGRPDAASCRCCHGGGHEGWYPGWYPVTNSLTLSTGLLPCAHRVAGICSAVLGFAVQCWCSHIDGGTCRHRQSVNALTVIAMTVSRLHPDSTCGAPLCANKMKICRAHSSSSLDGTEASRGSSPKRLLPAAREDEAPRVRPGSVTVLHTPAAVKVLPDKNIGFRIACTCCGARPQAVTQSRECLHQLPKLIGRVGGRQQELTKACAAKLGPA